MSKLPDEIRLYTDKNLQETFGEWKTDHLVNRIKTEMKARGISDTIMAVHRSMGRVYSLNFETNHTVSLGGKSLSPNTCICMS